jgi:hypothetical protein
MSMNPECPLCGGGLDRRDGDWWCVGCELAFD